MAFGIPPKYSQDFPLEGLTSEQFLAIAIETTEKLNWSLDYVSKTGFIAYTVPSMNSAHGEVFRVTLSEGTAKLKSSTSGNQLMDWGKNRENIQRFTRGFAKVKSRLSPEEFTERLEVVQEAIHSDEPDMLGQTTREKIADFLSYFKPTTGYYITPLLINLNLLIFILMAFSGVDLLSPDGESLVAWGANFRPVTLAGEWWRLLTSCFVHIGVLHLLLNLYALMYIGLLLEPHLGKTRFAAAYLLTGIAASTASLWWHDFTISAGASGAIFGLYGVFLAMLTTNLIEKSARNSLLTSIGIFVGYNLLYGMKGGIDNAAHIGGLVSGIIVGYAFYPGLKSSASTQLKYGAIGLLGLVFLSSSFVVYQQLPKDIIEYDKRMEEFVDMETQALGVFEMQPSSTTEEVLSAVQDKGIDLWQQNIKLLKEVDQMNLPDELHERNQKLIHYCQLRIKSYEFIYQAMKYDTEAFQDSIDYYNSEIERTIKSL